MSKLTALAFLMFGLSLSANADIWKWVDEDGNVHYADTPAPQSGVNSQLVSYTPVGLTAATSSGGRDTAPQDTSAEEQAREKAQAYYCERAKEIYNAYLGAPRLFRTAADGQREYLSDKEAAATLAEAEASVAEWCN